MNVFDWIVLALVAAAAAAAVVWMVRRKKSGRCIGCGGNCANCRFNSERIKKENGPEK